MAKDRDRIECAPGVDAPLLRRILVAEPVREIHRNRRSAVTEVRVDDRSYARKEYQRRSPLDRLLPSPARRSWRLLLRGAHEGLPLPEPIGLALPRDGGRGVLVTRWFPGDHLHLTHARHRERLRDPIEARRFAEAVAVSLVKLWRRGLRTRDLAPQNLLVGRVDGTWRACLVDLDDVRLATSPSPTAILRGLSQLGHLPTTITPRQRLLGLHCFLEAGGTELLAPWLEGRGALGLRRELHERIRRLSEEKGARLRALGADQHPHAGFGLDASGDPVR